MDEAEARDLVRRELAGYAVDYETFVERRRRLIGSAWRVGIRRVGELAELAGVQRAVIYEDLESLALPHQPCQVCGRLLGDQKPVVGVVLGIAPEDRISSGDGWTNAAMAIVHDECAGPGRFAAV